MCERMAFKSRRITFVKKCSRCFCESCNDQHSRMFKIHNSIGLEEKWRWQIEMGEENLGTFFNCQEHSNETIKLVCQDHDQLLCEKCDLSSHRKCRVYRIANIMKRQHHIPGFQQLLDSIESKQGQLDQFKDGRRKEIQELQATCDKQFADIEMFRQQIDESLNRLEAKAKKQLVDLRVRLKTVLEADVDKCCVVKQKLQLLKNALTKFGECPEHSYIAYKTIQEFTRDTDVLTKSKAAKRSVKPKFTPQTIIEEYVSLKSVLGNITCDETTARNDIMYVTGESFHNVRHKNEQSTCYINGICELPWIGFLIIDSTNKIVKLLDMDFDTIACLSLSNSPTSICLIDSNEVDEVAISYFNSIDFLELDCTKQKLLKKRSLYLDHACTSITYGNSSLFVTTGTELYIYAIDGRQIKKVYTDISTSGTVSGCAVGNVGDKIYVVNTHNGSLLSLSRNGDVLAKLIVSVVKDWYYSKAHVHVAQTGQILFCCAKSQSIIQVDTECTKILKTLCIKQYSEQQPQSVCYSKVKSAIVVGMNFDKILVLKTKTFLC